MEKFLLLVREDLKKLSAQGEDGRDDDTLEMMRWVEELGQTGNYVAGEALLVSGAYLKKDRVMSDGPFIEAKEGISGFILINAENMNQAISIAQTCPLIVTEKVSLEVRPVMKLPNEPVSG